MSKLVIAILIMIYQINAIVNTEQNHNEIMLAVIKRNVSNKIVKRSEDLKDTIIAPCIDQVIQPKVNILWCNTFQIAWNELCDFIGGSVKVMDAPAVISCLNMKSASKNDINEDSYVVSVGLASEQLFEEIRQEVRKKFKQEARLEYLGSKEQSEWMVYSYLYKELPFRWRFDRFYQNLLFQGCYVDSFGIKQLLNMQDDEEKMASQVKIFDYRNRDDFIIELTTESIDDSLILAKISPEATLAQTVYKVEERISQTKPTNMRELEDIYVPVLDFDILKVFNEISKVSIEGGNKNIDKTNIVSACQNIRFRLDERGAVLNSESIIALGIDDRTFKFDKPYLIYLKRRGAKAPYFVMWVANTELMVSSHK